MTDQHVNARAAVTMFPISSTMVTNMRAAFLANHDGHIDALNVALGPVGDELLDFVAEVTVLLTMATNTSRRMGDTYHAFIGEALAGARQFLIDGTVPEVES